MKLRSLNWNRKSHLKMNYLLRTKPLPFLFSPLCYLWCSLMSCPLQRWFIMRQRRLHLGAFKGTWCKTNRETYCYCCLVVWLLQPQRLYNWLFSVNKCSWCNSFCRYPRKAVHWRSIYWVSLYVPGTGLCEKGITERASHSWDVAGKKCTIWSSSPGHPSRQNCNLKRHTHPNVHSSTIHNSQHMGAT